MRDPVVIVDLSDLESLAVELYKRFKFDPSEPKTTFELAKRWLGPKSVERRHIVGAVVRRDMHDGKWRIGVRPNVPIEYANFLVGHELGHLLLAEAGFSGDDEEKAADYLGAALIAPRPAVNALHRAFGLNLGPIAEEATSTQTWAALRIGEVFAMPLAALAPAIVRVRGPESFVWPDERTIRSWARRPRPGLRKVRVTDSADRLVLVVEEEIDVA